MPSGEKPAIGIAMQAYLRDCEKDLTELVLWAKKQNRKIGVRLVKGAYWDYETTLALQRDWPIPVWSRKAESDASYEKLSLFLLENIDIVLPGLCFAQCAFLFACDRPGGAPRHRSSRL